VKAMARFELARCRLRDDCSSSWSYIAGEELAGA
jgi:hypothetical protein